jgi:subtilase family serine protease
VAHAGGLRGPLWRHSPRSGEAAAWLETQGFQVGRSPDRTVIRFDARAEQVRKALGTEIHHYSVNGVMHYANAGPPTLPAALAPQQMASFSVGE